MEEEGGGGGGGLDVCWVGTWPTENLEEQEATKGGQMHPPPLNATLHTVSDNMQRNRTCK